MRLDCTAVHRSHNAGTLERGLPSGNLFLFIECVRRHVPLSRKLEVGELDDLAIAHGQVHTVDRRGDQ